jgi:hypothetical protein
MGELRNLYILDPLWPRLEVKLKVNTTVAVYLGEQTSPRGKIYP